MKKIFILVLFCLVAHLGFSQWTTNGTHIYSTNSGNVGIGVMNPLRKLHIDGHIKQSFNKFFVNTRTNGSDHISYGFDANNNMIFNFSAIVEGKSSGTIIGVAGAGKFIDFRRNGGTSLMRILPDGNVGIGTTDPGSFLLAVNGLVGAREIQVTVEDPFPDYVFDSSYELMPLNELKAYINKNRHLPDIPSAREVKENGGIQLGEQYVLLLKKVEELTLYVIEQNEKIVELEEKTQNLILENKELSAKFKQEKN